MENLFKFFFLVSGLCFASAINLPSDLTFCKRDGDFKECLRNSVEEAFKTLKDGYPNFKLSSLDPLFVPSLIIGAGTGAVKVEQKFQNVNYVGISTTRFEAADLEETPTNAKIILDAFIDDFQLRADYDINGKLLVLPVVGNGKCVVTLRKLKIKFVLKGDLVERKGNKYLKVKECAISLAPGKVYYHFENLFGGDKVLSDQIHNVLNDNWKDVFEDVKASYEESVAIMAVNLSNAIFKNIPYDEIFPK